MKKWTKIVSIFALAAVVMILSQMPVKANVVKKNTDDTFEETYMKIKDISYGYPLFLYDERDQPVSEKCISIVSVKSSNKKVVEAGTWGNDMLMISPRRKGIATVTVKCEYEGKTYTYRSKVTVVQDKPFKYIKYGKKNIYKGKEYKSGFTYKARKKSNVLSWKLAKGYTIVQAEIAQNGGLVRQLKNKKKVTLHGKKAKHINFTIRNPKGMEYTYQFYIQKK